MLVSKEDDELRARWLEGPGARPTEADRQRWLKASREGRFPVVASRLGNAEGPRPKSGA